MCSPSQASGCTLRVLLGFLIKLPPAIFRAEAIGFAAILRLGLRILLVDFHSTDRVSSHSFTPMRNSCSVDCPLGAHEIGSGSSCISSLKFSVGFPTLSAFPVQSLWRMRLQLYQSFTVMKQRGEIVRRCAERTIKKIGLDLGAVQQRSPAKFSSTAPKILN